MDSKQRKQRLWRGIPVDGGLSDEWLQAINSLQCWVPYSTCEGHAIPDEKTSPRARVYLELKPQFVNSLVALWRRHEAEFQDLRLKVFPAMSTWSQLCVGKLITSPLGCSLQLESRHERETEEKSEMLAAWLDATAVHLQEFDAAFHALLVELAKDAKATGSGV